MNKPAPKQLRTRNEMEAAFDRIMKGRTWLDLHVHDMPDCCGPGLALQGPDAAHDYHYLYGEVASGLQLDGEQMDALWKAPQRDRVDFLVKHSLGDGSLPVSEGRLGLLTAAHALGLPTECGDYRRVLDEWRQLFADLGPVHYTNRIFQAAGINRVISTQSPFVPQECTLYLDDKIIAEWDPRYWVGLRWDEFVHRPDLSDPLCKGPMNAPDAVGPLSAPATANAARKLLEFWIDRLPNVKYVALSLPGSTCLSDRTSRITQALQEVIIPVAKERRLPLFLMPFVRRGLNPSFRNAGDCVERGDLNGLIDFIARHPEVVFAVTPLDEGDNYPLCFATRALPNLRLWGHWWGNLNPSLIEAQLKMRLEMTGYVHYGVNSDARIRDQLLFKWPHYFRVLKRVIVQRCLDIMELSGWPITEDEIAKSIGRLQNWEKLLVPGTAA